VCVADGNARRRRQQATLFQMKNVVDEVNITEALYDVNAGSVRQPPERHAPPTPRWAVHPAISRPGRSSTRSRRAR
jgi:hypothetical protein